MKPIEFPIAAAAAAIGVAIALWAAGLPLLAREAPRDVGSSVVVPGGDLPVVREASYVVNARVRPLLLFWIGRDNVGDARLTWRAGSRGRRAFALLVGSDPARAPRRINRWGFLGEALDGNTAEVLGLMKESNEKTLEEADARTAQQEGTLSTFRATRATITTSRAVSASMTLHASAHLTYRELDELLALLPVDWSRVRTLELPPGTQTGFLVAMDSFIRRSLEPCRNANNGSARDMPRIPYVYSQTVYDLWLLSCVYIPQSRISNGTLAPVVDGRFRVRNRTTKNETNFRLSYGTTGTLRELPVRAVFRPNWWMEIELVLDPTSTGRLSETSSH